MFDPEGDVRFTIDFDRDALQLPCVAVVAEAELPLQCQRSLQRFLLPVRVEQKLGLIRDEADEAALPEGYEPLLVPADGLLRPLDLVEDELILAMPVVPVGPGTDPLEGDWPQDAEEPRREHPFAALSALKKPGDISPIVKTVFGYHVLKLVAHNPDKQKSFDEIRAGLVEKLRNDWITQRMAQYTGDLRGKPLQASPDLVASLRTRYLPPGTVTPQAAQRSPAPG